MTPPPSEGRHRRQPGHVPTRESVPPTARPPAGPTKRRTYTSRPDRRSGLFSYPARLRDRVAAKARSFTARRAKPTSSTSQATTPKTEPSVPSQSSLRALTAPMMWSNQADKLERDIEKARHYDREDYLSGGRCASRLCAR
jgi:hypothetical protein